MREALYFRNISFSLKLDSESDVSKYGQIRPRIRRPYPAGYENMAGFRRGPGPDMISGAILVKMHTRIINIKPRERRLSRVTAALSFFFFFFLLDI